MCLFPSIRILELYILPVKLICMKNVKDVTYILHVLCTLHVCTKESDFSMLKKSDGWTTDDFTCCNLFCISQR